MQREPLSTARNQMNSRDNNRISKRSNHANNNNNPSLAVQATVPALTPAQMYSNFEEWIKMCTDNKVNATNTWNFALIDYFHEMTFIREGDSINFQKASCTLDGCVKIYTSRVDSVATETGKLLSGLADSTHGDGDDENRSEKRVRRKTNRSEATLLKDFSSIALKKFDLDFAVDPLFKKTSADFDEGGARGLLLNHLGIDRYCKIIFDASDATVDCDLDELDGHAITIDHIELHQESEPEEDASTSENSESEDDPMEEDDDPEAMDSQEDDSKTKMAPEPTSEIVREEGEKEDLSVAEVSVKKDVSNEESRVEIFRLKSKLPDFQSLPDLHIVPFLKGFDFFTDNDDDLAFPDLDLDNEMENDIPAAPIQNEDEGFQFDDYDVDFGGDEDVDPFQFDNNDQPFDNDSPHEFGQDAEEEKDFPDNDFLSALIHNNQGENDMFNYFDSTLVKNWAGPEHWKLRRPVTQKVNNHTDGQEEGPDKSTTNTTTKKRTKVAEFLLPFDQEENEDAPPTFEAAARKPALSKDVISKMSDNLLPDDIHFSSKLLLQYSLKPAFLHNHKKKKASTKSSENNHSSGMTQEENEGINADVDFWADQTTQDFSGGGVDDMMMDDFGDDMPTSNFDDDTGLDQTMLTAFEDTSYYHDTYDDPETSVLYGDELITNHRLKKTKPLYVKYARTAKRVDVKKLKDNLWKALTIQPTEAEAKADATANADAEEDKVCGVQKFTNIVHSLKKMYSPKTLRDISVPFCFIVLLHLANEKDLSIKGLGPDIDEDDFVLGESDWMTNEDILNEVTITQN